MIALKPPRDCYTRAQRCFVEVQELLALPEHWTKDATARDFRGRRCDPRGGQACAWCLLGAMKRAACLSCDYDRVMPIMQARLGEALRSLGHYGSVGAFNDAADHPRVLALLAAILAQDPYAF